jgi:hypothetical protein
MNNIVVGCAKKIVFTAFLFCLLNVGIVNIMGAEELDKKPPSVSVVLKSNDNLSQSSRSFSSFWSSATPPKQKIVPGISLKSKLSSRFSATEGDKSSSRKAQSLGLPVGSLFVDAGGTNGDRVEDYSECDDRVTYEDHTTLPTCGNSRIPVDFPQTSVCQNSLGEIEISSDTDESLIMALENPIVDRKIIRILFVEDSDLIKKFFNRFVDAINNDPLNDYIYEAVVCTWGYEALDLYKNMVSQGKSPHLIFTDINMEEFYQKRGMCRKDINIPSKAGIELVKAIRGQKCQATLLERLTEGKSEMPASLYAYKKMGAEGKRYMFVQTRDDNFTIYPYEGPIIALTSDPEHIVDEHKHLFYVPEDPGEEENLKIIYGIRGKLKNKDDLIKILSHHGLAPTTGMWVEPFT